MPPCPRAMRHNATPCIDRSDFPVATEPRLPPLRTFLSAIYGVARHWKMIARTRLLELRTAPDSIWQRREVAGLWPRGSVLVS